MPDRDGYRDYLRKQKLLKENTVNSYCSGINHITQHGDKDVFSIIDPQSLETIVRDYGIGGVNADVGNYRNGSARNALRHWKDFVAASGESNDKNIEPDIDDEDSQGNHTTTAMTNEPSKRLNCRYKGHPIGNSQNAFIRTILSNLGDESFSRKDWESTNKYFSHECAYCKKEGALQIDHVIPINKAKLGEHKLGNLVPSCKECNGKKHDKDFREFLGENTEAITRIEKYMAEKEYVPLAISDELNAVFECAHKEVAALAARYIEKINKLISNESISGPGIE